MQIGVIGSAKSLGYDKQLVRIAEEVGKEIASTGAILVYGVEKDQDSLSSIACRAAKKKGALTVGITYDNARSGIVKNLKYTDVIIYSGLIRGGGRELVLSLSCDGIIAINGGAGTLTEIAIAYQSKIPVVVLENTGGWSAKLANTYIDERERVYISGAQNASEAVKMLLKKINK